MRIDHDGAMMPAQGHAGLHLPGPGPPGGGRGRGGRHRGHGGHPRRRTSARPSPTPLDPRPLPPIHVEEPTAAHDLQREQQPVRRARGHLCHQPQAARAPVQRAGARRGPARGGHRKPRYVPGQRARRAAPGDPDRDDAPRGLRVPGLQARSDLQGDRRPAPGAVRAGGDRGRRRRCGRGGRDAGPAPGRAAGHEVPRRRHACTTSTKCPRGACSASARRS